MSALLALVTMIVIVPTSASAQQAPLPLPSELRVEVHLPGPDANRHLHVTVDIGGGTTWIIEGCVSSGAGCYRTRRVELTAAQRAEYVRSWGELRAIPRCEPDGIFPGDRAFRLTSSQGDHSGNLPANVSELAARNTGPCRAPARMAWWVASVFGP